MAKHIVLVHGAWQGAWSFAYIIPLLSQSGWTVHAIDLPGNGYASVNAEANLANYSQQVIQCIENIPEPVVLLGHSGGGQTIAQVAEYIPQRIRHLVFLAGMMLPSGMSFIEFKQFCQQHYPQHNFAGIAPYLSISAKGMSTVSHQGIKTIFLPDCPADKLEQLLHKFRPQAETGRDLKTHLTQHNYGRVAKLYIEACDDQSIPIQMQRLMQTLDPQRLEVLSMPTGHVPQVVQPALLVEKLNQYFCRWD